MQRNYQKATIIAILLGLLILLQEGCFYHLIHYNIAPFYPANFDQATMAQYSYLFSHRSSQLGWYYALLSLPFFAKGPLFVLFSGTLNYWFGNTRFVLLSVNIVSFYVLQITAAYVTYYFTKRIGWVLMTLAALLLAHTTYYFAGGITDFRLDFFAACWFGIWLLLMVRSDMLLHKGWAFFTILATIILLGSRIITFTYWFGICGCMLLTFFGMWMATKSPTYRTLFWRWLAYGLLICALMITMLLKNFDYLKQYYIVGHMTGQEKYIREAVAGVKNWWDVLRYYPYSLLSEHLDWEVTILLMAPIAACSVLWFLFHNKRHPETSPFQWQHFCFLIASCVVPLIILTLDTSKSPVVADVLVVPIIILFIFFCYHMLQRINLNTLFSPIILVFSIIVLYHGCRYVYKNTHVAIDPTQQEINHQISNLYEQVDQTIQQQHLTKITVSSYPVLDYLYGSSLTTFLAEKNKWAYLTQSSLGLQVTALPLNTILEYLSQSNLLLWQISGRLPYPNYPQDQSIAKHQKQILAYIHQHFKQATMVSVDHRRIAIFYKPQQG